MRKEKCKKVCTETIMKDIYEELEKDDILAQEDTVTQNESDTNSSDSDDKEVQEEKGNKFFKELMSWVMIFVGAFVVAYILSNFVIVNAKVPTGSMISTININDKVIGFRLSYIFSNPERGDIIMFNAPDKENTIYIKRVIGLPGDVIRISNNELYINGELKEESYVKNGWRTNTGDVEYTVPKNEYFVMGDNRDNSSDSRVWGTIKRDDIIAKAIFRYYPSFKSLLN